MSSDFETWAKALRAKLDELAVIDLGYPQGENVVREGTEPAPDLPHGLKDMYGVIGGVSLPDVHVGYFIDSAENVVKRDEFGEPNRVEGPHQMDIIVFASDGGGGRFAMNKDDGAIYFLPSSGAVRSNVYQEDEVSSPRLVATNLIDFLWRLVADAEAFIEGQDGHDFLSS